MNLQHYQNKKVLVTGHTGFKGSWLMLLLRQLGAEVHGLSLQADKRSLFDVIDGEELCQSYIADIRDIDNIEQIIHNIEPDYIFHLAAQSLVIDGYEDPIYTYETNVMGTLNILQVARKLDACNVIVVTTDKVYENPETGDLFKEGDKLGGYDPYSSSKACAEILTSSMRRSFFKSSNSKIVSARAGNVIGGGDFTANRLLPDIAKSLSNNDTIVLRSPDAVRPWQHVLDGLMGYLLLGIHMVDGPTEHEWNFGPKEEEKITVKEVTQLAINLWGAGQMEVQPSELHEAKNLRLDSTRAIEVLSWNPKLNASEAVQWSIEWYKGFYSSEDPLELTKKQINRYLEVE